MSTRFSAVVVTFLLLAAPTCLRADPVSELKSFSAFESVDLVALAQGNAQTTRGPAMNTARFQSVQSCWVTAGSPSQVLAALRSFNPTRHSELKVLSHVNGSNFSQLSNLPNDSAVDWLTNATEHKSPELQLSRQEAAKSAPFAQFWSSVLSARASAGVFGQAAYDHTGKDIRPGEDMSTALGQQAKIRKQFSGLIGSKGEQYWELLDVDHKGVLTLGTSFNRNTSGGSTQAADVLYYASGGYYVALTLYQMWPVQVGGKASTLVWRGDLISSAELADLHGVERLGSESAMMKDVSKSIRAFRGDSSR
ncbi:MAG: hypothetical protein ACR2HH_05465 [Chthoniobacterales bacterium]